MDQVTFWEAINQLKESWLLPFNDFVHTALFQQYSLFFIFIVASLPFFAPVPNEVFVIPAYYADINPIFIVIAVGIGGFVGDIGLYFLGSKLIRRITRTKHDQTLNADHWIHRHGLIVYVISPSLVWGFGDIVMIVSGHQGVKLSKIAPFILIGEFIVAIWRMLIVIGLFAVPKVF